MLDDMSIDNVMRLYKATIGKDLEKINANLDKLLDQLDKMSKILDQRE